MLTDDNRLRIKWSLVFDPGGRRDSGRTFQHGPQSNARQTGSLQAGLGCWLAYEIAITDEEAALNSALVSHVRFEGEQIGNSYLKCQGDGPDVLQRRVSHTTLDPGQICHVETCPVGDLFLRQTM